MNTLLMKEERSNELLNQIIDYTSIERNCDETIKELLKMGFKPEELYNHFGFNLLDIADAMEENQSN